MQQKKKIWYYFFEMMILLIILSNALYSANHVKKIEINPLNRATVFCTDIPEDFKSRLSDDKLKITVTLPNSTIEDEARKVSGKGIITDVYAQKQDTSLDIMVMLKDKRGYTAAMLPYTKTIILETFDWKKLSKEEDEYRSGLLAYEGKIYAAAKAHFEKAIVGDIPDVGVYLGIVYLKAGDLNKAMESFITARSSGTKLPDVYAGLAQIYSMKGDNDKAKHYRELFKKETGQAYFPYLDIADSLKLEIPKDEQFSLLSESDLSENKDTAVPDQKSIIKDSLNKEAKTDTTATKPTTELSEPSWLTYILIAAALLLFVVLSSYIKWRKQQLKNAKPKKNDEFNQDLEKVKKTLAPTSHAAKKYQENDQISKDKKPATPKQKQAAPKENPDAGKELEKLAKKLKQEQEKNERDKLDENIIEKNTVEKQNKSKINAKLELAMHLQKEQQKLKKKNIETLKESVKPSDIDKMSDIAKKLGIEKGMVEADKQLKKLTTDKDTISKLADKFKKSN
jgi:hypothetical protein